MIDWQIAAARAGEAVTAGATKSVSFFDALSRWFNIGSTTFDGLTPAILSAFITGSIALIALRTNAAVNLRNKRVDVIIHCNTRYDELYKFKVLLIQRALALKSISSKKSLDVASSRIELKEDIRLYFRRFWGMKSDQIDYWLSGYIDPETLISWFMSTIDAIHAPVEAWKGFSVTESGGWDEVKEFHQVTNPRMHQVVELISQPHFKKMKPHRRYAELFELFQGIERAERTLIRMLTRNSHARLTMARFEGKLPATTAYALDHVRAAEFRRAVNLPPLPNKDTVPDAQAS